MAHSVWLYIAKFYSVTPFSTVQEYVNSYKVCCSTWRWCR